MADLKISQLTAITTLTPATDVLPVVDVTGTTKKITTNQILGSGGTATLSSATITGDLTVDTNVLKVDTTNNRVGIGTATPGAGYSLDILGAAVGGIRVSSNNYPNLVVDSANSNGALIYIQEGGTTQARIGHLTAVTGLEFSGNNGTAATNVHYAIDSTGISTWKNVGGVAGTAMTLNSTGLGVGVSPDFKFAVNGTQAVPDTTGSSTTNGSLRIGAPGTNLVIDTGVTAAGAVYGWIQARSRTDYSSNYNLVLQPNGGNVGIGVSPSYRLDINGTLRISNFGIIRFDTGTNTGFIDYNDTRLQLHAGSLPMYFVAGNTLKMTLDTSGNLGIGVSTFGTSAARVLSIGTVTEPTTGPTGTVQFFSSTRSANNTIPAIFCEGSGVTNAAITNTTVTNKIAIKVNGTIYYLLATTSAV